MHHFLFGMLDWGMSQIMYLSFWLKKKNSVLSAASIMPTPSICSSYQLGKSKRLLISINENCTTSVLGLIHRDLWGPTPILSSSGFRFYVIFVDDHSRFTWFYPLKTKAKFYETFIYFQRLVENQFNTKIKIFQCDGGTKFTNFHFKTHLENKSIQQQNFCPYMLEQNDRAERKHWHKTEVCLTLLFHSHVPSSLWVEVFSIARFIINWFPTSVLKGNTPYELLFGKKPSYNIL